MWRNVLGVIAGAAAWMAAFNVLAFGLAALWTDFASHGVVWIKEQRFTFTAGMSACNLLFWVLSALVAGWVVMKITRRQGAVWVLATLLTAYMGVNHLVIYWSTIPWWYNVIAVVVTMPGVLLGARLGGAADQAAGYRYRK